MMMDQLYTYQNGKVYKGTTTLPFDVVLTLSGNPTPAEVFGILLALEFL